MRPASRRAACRRRARKSNPFDILLAAAALGGLLLAARPIYDGARSTSEAQEVIASMTAQTDETNDPKRMEVLRQAQHYNAELVSEGYAVDNAGLGGSNGGDNDVLALYEEGQTLTVEAYERQLLWSGYPAMCWMEIPAIGVKEPIFHGTSDEALAQGVGHVEWSSLPVGGRSSNCVLAAHSGMQDRSMFDNLDKLKDGDIIVIHTLGDCYEYEVYSSEVVKPNEAKERCAIQTDNDECTLMTCTPYGINSHRLLVHAHRVAYTEAKEHEVLPAVVTTLRSEVSSRRNQPMLLALTGLSVPFLIFRVKRYGRGRR